MPAPGFFEKSKKLETARLNCSGRSASFMRELAIGRRTIDRIEQKIAMRISRLRFEFARPVAMLGAATGLIAGCASSQFVNESIPTRMKAHPDVYRRVGILSVAMTTRAITDSSLTTNDLTRVSRRLGTNLLEALTQAFADKGYRVTDTANPLCTVEDWDGIDRETSGLATEVRTHLVTLGEEIYANQPNEKFHPIDYKIPVCVAELGKKLGQDHVDIFVLLDARVYVETPEARHKRNRWNRTGGVILIPLVVGVGLFAAGGGGGSPELPLKHTPAWVAHTILIADAHTREVLYWNSRTFLHEDARNSEAMRGKFRELLDGFAELPKHR